MKNKQKGIVNTGFTPANNELARRIIKDCGLNAYAVYIIILSHRNTNDNECFPTNAVLAEECNCTDKTIRNNIDKLVKFGYLIVNSGYKGKASNYYFPDEIDLTTKKSIYSDAELNYINKIERRTNKQAEEIPAQDNNITDPVGNVEDNIEQDNETFTPVGKEYNDADLFEEESLESTLSTPKQEDETTILNINSTDYMEEFYINMHTYFDVNDKSIKTNKTIINKVNEIVDYINTEFTTNNINIPAGKIIDNVFDEKQKGWKYFLSQKNPKNDFGICNLILSTLKNAVIAEVKEYANNKSKNAKVNNSIIVNDGVAEGMNDLYFNDDNYDKEVPPEYEDIVNKDNFDKAIEQLELLRDNTVAKKIIYDVAGFFRNTTKLKDMLFMEVEKVNIIVNKLNKELGYDILNKPKNNIISINKDKTFIENGVTYGINKDGFSYVVDDNIEEYPFEFPQPYKNKRLQ